MEKDNRLSLPALNIGHVGIEHRYAPAWIGIGSRDSIGTH